MAAIPGKNKQEIGTTLSYDDTGGVARDLSCDIVPGSLSINGITYEEINFTGICNAVENYAAGRGKLEIACQFYMNDTASTGAWNVIKAQNGARTSTGYTLTIAMGSAGQAPASGDPELEGEFGAYIQGNTISGGAWVFNVKFLPNSSTAPAWDTVA